MMAQHGHTSIYLRKQGYPKEQLKKDLRSLERQRRAKHNHKEMHLRKYHINLVTHGTPTLMADDTLATPIQLTKEQQELIDDIIDIEVEDQIADLESQETLDEFEQELLAAFKAHLDPDTGLTTEQAIIIEDLAEITIEEEIEILQNKETCNAEDEEFLDALLAYQSAPSESVPETPTEENMTEKQVEDSVERHLKKMPKANGMLSIQRQMPISMGSDIRRADLVLCSHFPFQMLVIVECKKWGDRGQKGIGQLQSYLCATDTQLGIFAASWNPKSWNYYENLGENTFREIKQAEFEKRMHRKDFGIRCCKERIELRVEARISEEVERLVQQTEIPEKYIQEVAQKRLMDDEFISKYALGHLKRKIHTQEQQLVERDAELEKRQSQHLKEIANLQENSDDNRNWAIIGWTLLIIILVVLVFS